MRRHRNLITWAKASAAILLPASPLAAEHLIVRNDYGIDGQSRQLGVSGPLTTLQRSFHLDAADVVWLTTDVSALRYQPSPVPGADSPTLRIGGVHVAGQLLPPSPFATPRMPALQLSTRRRQVQLDYWGLGFGAHESLQFQARLDGVDDEWGAVTSQSSIRYAGLGPGRYRFRVRAVSATGRVSAKPVTLDFTIAPPLWRRASFLAGLAALVACALVYAYKLRVGQLFELERIRTRIAADLHDDLGANLARVSLLSEATRRALRDKPDRAERMLDEIETASRELVTAAGDIAFAIDPEHGRLDDLAARLRRFAEDLLAGSDIALRFSVDPEAADVVLSSDQRRHLLAIAKEALHNAVRHARPRHVSLTLTLRDRVLEADIVDDGCGFRIDASRNGRHPEAGHGLRNLRDRAGELGAHLEIITQPRAGTRVLLRCPLRSRPRMVMR